MKYCSVCFALYTDAARDCNAKHWRRDYSKGTLKKLGLPPIMVKCEKCGLKIRLEPEKYDKVVCWCGGKFQKE